MTSVFPVPDTVLPDLRAAASREALRQIARALELATGVDADAIHASLMEAEELGGSAIGDGVAVIGTHLPLKVCGRRLGGFAMLSRPIPFKGVAQHACDMVYVLVSPDEESQSHLRDLSSVIRVFRDKDLLDRLRQAGSADRILSLFKGRDARAHSQVAA